jgi:hypothetical protein
VTYNYYKQKKNGMVLVENPATPTNNRLCGAPFIWIDI